MIANLNPISVRSSRKSRSSGYIVFEDSFRVAILTGFRKSSNRKTGAMLQLWILVKAQDPISAVKSGEDKRVCGNCPHRGTTCYVDRSRAPLAIWRKYRAGGYSRLSFSEYSIVEGWNIRLGAYGDPAFVPLPLLKELLSYSKGWTGYTHQWRNPLFAGLRSIVMASVDSHQEQIEATSAGWRTFRIQNPGNARFNDEIQCPASKEAGEKTQCNRCLLCCGTSKRARNIVINVHGAGASKFARN